MNTLLSFYRCRGEWECS